MFMNRILLECGAASVLLVACLSSAAAQISFGSTGGPETRKATNTTPLAGANTFGFTPDQTPQPVPQAPDQQAPGFASGPFTPQAGGPGNVPNNPGGGVPNAPGAGGPGYDPGGSSQPMRPPGLDPQQGGQTMSVRDYVVGTWRGQFSNPQMGSALVTVTFLPDGSFVQRMQVMSFQVMLTIAGRYDIQTDGQNGSIIFAVQQWQPRQICAPGNPYNCQPVTLPPQDVVGFRPLNRNAMQTTNGVFQRVSG